MLRRETATRLRLAAALAIAGALGHTAAAQPPSSPVPVRVSVTADRDHLAAILAAAEDASDRYAEWLGPAPFDRIEIVDRSSPPAPDSRTLAVAVDEPWSASSSLMVTESQVAYGVALGWLSGLRTRDDPVPIDEGLAWYLQSRIVERLFNLKTGVAAYNSEGVSLFGGTVRRAVPSLRLSRWTGGLGRDVFLRAEPARARRGGRTLPSGMMPDAVRAALGFGTLERWLGWPALQGGLASLARQSQERRLSGPDAVAVLSAAVGQDLSWFFDHVLDPARAFDYALGEIRVQQVADGCGAATCYRTEVEALRRGPAMFTGTSARPAGEYESGDALELRVELEDGQTASARWDGRAERRTFVFESTTQALRVSLDPDRVLLLNRDPLAASRSLSPQTNVPIAKWIARWAIWLQDTAIACTSLL
jgi:hypothetical protein